ncbi:MAG: pilus assembly protein TadG-related protein [Pirellulales bacterium]
MRGTRRSQRRTRRRGTALVLVVLALIPLMAFAALAIDLGLLAVARTQTQQAADAAAMSGARAINGNSANNNNYAAVSPTATVAATANSILGSQVLSSQLALDIGRYTYNSSAKRFEGQFPGPTGENWSLVKATISANVSTSLAFSKVFNFGSTNMTATAMAAHRPRDVAVILDFSGSMRFASLVATPISGDRSGNVEDTDYPQFGHYSSSSASMYTSSHTAPYIEPNISTTTSDNRAPIIEDFYTDANGSPAFSRAPSSYKTTPGGDDHLHRNLDTGSEASTLAQVLNLSSVNNATKDAQFEAQGYMAYGMRGSFSRYTQGPGYYGKTFFIWPPDPVNGPDGQTNDWRKRYFEYPGTNVGMDDNTRLWDSSGNWRSPSSSTYEIDYAAILNFIKNIGPNPFPSQMRSGRILYYDAIPDSISSSWPPSNQNERFWKDYIDYVLGLMQTGSSSWDVICNGSNGLTGYGADYTWGTVRINAKANLTATGNPPTAPYMRYDDNPRRPRLHFWFGPLTMIDFLGNYNMWGQVSPYASRYCWWPGTCHESPMYACKLGVRAGLIDAKDNHPNDMVSLIFFSAPKTSSGDTGSGRFNRVRVGLSRRYDDMIESLWYPPSTIGDANATIRPYDSDNMDAPRAMGGTCYAMPLMLAYNQFSGNTSLQTYSSGKPTGDAGGNGRKGAQKIIIFETDGGANTTANASFTNSGSHNSYYNVRFNYSNPNGSQYPNNVNGYSDNASTVTSQINSVCTQICALETASSPGYSSATKKVQIHCIGFGPQFDPATSGQSSRVATLNAMQVIGNVNDGMPSYKLVYGTESTMINNMQQAFTKILQNGIQISLIH